MARYFYNLSYGGSSPDTVGIELPTPERARLEATRFIGEGMTNDGERLWARAS